MTNAHDLLPVPCLWCGKRFASMHDAHTHMKDKHQVTYKLTEREEQAKKMRAYDHHRRAELKAERKRV